tara:strand:- start:1115 stop:1780 length:666 start_codon:yes stop_codon:yes gene_type:complete
MASPINEKHKTEATHANLTLLGKSQRGKDYRLYIFNPCGHEADLQIVHVRQNQVTCKTCLMQKRDKEAQAVGLTLIGPGHNKDYKLYRFDACSHETELQISHVRNNSFVCNVCEETSRTQPSYTYLLKITVGEVSWLKYGYAKSIDFRTKRYGLPASAVVKLLAHECFATGNEAHAREAAIHLQLGKHKLSTRKMSKYHAKSGKTECYPMLLLHEFLNTFK